MKKILLTASLFSLSLFGVEIKQEYIDNTQKYKSLSENKADVEFAKNYEGQAKKNLNKNFEYMKQLNSQEPSTEEKEKIKEKYKNLEPTQEEKSKFKEKYKDLEKFNLNNKYEKEKITLEEGPSLIRKNSNEEKIIFEDEKQLKEYENLINEDKDKQNLKENFMNNLQYQTNLLDNKKYFNKEIEKIKTENESYNKKNQTIFFFVSSDMRIEAFKGFVEHINKLRRKGHTVVGRVIFRGWINDKTDGIPNWLKQMQKDGLKNSEFVKYQFHPWAFRYFELKKVPAYELSSCNEDFKFRTCENKYLIKGDINLIEFYRILSEENKEYLKTYRDLIEEG
jgi:hypothetical protein